MKSLCAVAVRLNCGIKNLLVQLQPNHGLRRCSTMPAVSPKKKRNKRSLDLSDHITRGLEWIRRCKSTSINGKTLYLINEDVAKEFAALIMADRQNDRTYVAEINSGFGFLSKQLLDAGIRSLNMFESVPNFLPNLSSLVDRYEGRVTLRPIDFQQLWSVGYKDWKDNTNKLNSHFDMVGTRAWEEGPATEIIGCLGDSNFIGRLISTVIFQTTFARFGRTVLHVAVPPSVWLTLTSENDHYLIYRKQSILFQTLFDGKVLGRLPRSAFFPHYRSPARTPYGSPGCKVEITKNDARLMYVVKIEPKANLFKNDFTMSDIVPFYYFIHHHLRSRSTRIIPALEKWVPGCGRALILKGFNIFTEFGELKPQELFDLFQLFKSWPQYKKSSFVSCMDSFLMRMDEHIVFDTNSENLEEMFKFSLDEAQTYVE